MRVEELPVQCAVCQQGSGCLTWVPWGRPGWWSNRWPHPSGMFSLHRGKGKDDSIAKPSAAGCLERKKQYYLLQLFKHCCRQTVLVQAESGGKLQFLFVLLSNGAVKRDRRLSGSLDTRAHVSTLHFSGLRHSHSATYFCAMSTQSSPGIVGLYPNLYLILQASLQLWLYGLALFLHVSARKNLKQMGKDSA